GRARTDVATLRHRPLHDGSAGGPRRGARRGEGGGAAQRRRGRAGCVARTAAVTVARRDSTSKLRADPDPKNKSLRIGSVVDEVVLEAELRHDVGDVEDVNELKAWRE